MRSLVLALTCLVSTSSIAFAPASQSQEPPKYPVGQYCSPKGDVIRGRQTTAHPCKCKRHDQIESDDPDAGEKGRMCKAGEATNPSHDAVCMQWCNESQCACPIECDVKSHR